MEKSRLVTECTWERARKWELWRIMPDFRLRQLGGWQPFTDQGSWEDREFSFGHSEFEMPVKYSSCKVKKTLGSPVMAGLEPHSYCFIVRHKTWMKMKAYFHSKVKSINVTKQYPLQIQVLAESVESIYSFFLWILQDGQLNRFFSANPLLFTLGSSFHPNLVIKVNSKL